MFNLGKKIIREHSSDFSFDRGLEYHYGNRVRSIQYNPQKRLFTAVVHDLKERNASVAFDRDGSIINAQCSCRLPGKSLNSFCEHIVAMLLLIEQRDNEGFFSQLKDREKARRIFELFAYPQINAQDDEEFRRETVQLDAIYILPSTGKGGAGASGAGAIGAGGGGAGANGAGASGDEKSGAGGDGGGRDIENGRDNELLAGVRTGAGKTNRAGSSINTGSHSTLNAFLSGEPLFESFFMSIPERNSRFIFRIKSGVSTYLVKNIGRFVLALSKKRPVDFSKKFTFDPSRHILDGFDAIIGEYLIELLEASSGGLKHGVLSETVNTEVFDDKFLCLTDRQFRRFIDLYAKNGRPLPVYKDDAICDVPILDEAIPLSFRLGRDINDFILKVYAGNDLLPLTSAGDIVQRQNTIYRLPESQAQVIKPFLSLLDNDNENDFRFISEDRIRFVSEVLPVIDRIGNLTIDEDVSSLIEKKPIVIDIYLDREEGAVSADVRFRYGETEINPFAAAPKIKQEKPDNLIIVRDMVRENEFLDILAEANFKVKNGKINLYDDDSVFNLIVDILPKLQKYAGVYYSQEFRRMTVKRTVGFRANLSLRDGAGGLSDLLAFDFDTDLIDRDELIEIMRSIREKKRYYKLKDGTLLNIDDSETLDVMRLLEYVEAKDEDVINGHIALPRYRALFLDSFLRNSELRNIGRDRILRDFINTLSEPADSEFVPPVCVEDVLRDYQRTGFKWLKALSIYSLGGILADDMGLGKTLQVLVLLLSAKESAEGEPSNNYPSLIVAPTSLIYNWCAEIEKFTPDLKYLAIYGGKAERTKLIASIPEHDVVITSYPLIRRDYAEYKQISFHYLILDEAQYIKNPNSQNALTVKCLNARSRFALTGTPIENRLLDLWSIFDFVLPGYLRSAKDFCEKYAVESFSAKGRITGGVDEGDASDANGNDFKDFYEYAAVPDAGATAAGGGKRALDELSGQIKPFILRRLKSDVLRELPDKIDTRMYAQMTDEQKKLYLVYLEKIRMQLESEISEKGFEKSQFAILAALTRLRQICCHPALFIEDYGEESGKLLLLEELVREALGGGHRILLFSQFTEMLAIIRKWADGEGIEYHYIDGHIKAHDRHRMINEFNGGAGDMFLLSLKAGGAGVNLTGADTVIHYDPWWNPAVEDQATDRAYRIGQHKTVQVIKLLTAGSIEEKIFAIQERKKQLIDAVIHPGETFLTKLSKADLDEILSI